MPWTAKNISNIEKQIFLPYQPKMRLAPMRPEAIKKHANWTIAPNWHNSRSMSVSGMRRDPTCTM
jgi:hypothetical protein